jgi:hypothetical protein
VIRYPFAITAGLVSIWDSSERLIDANRKSPLVHLVRRVTLMSFISAPSTAVIRSPRSEAPASAKGAYARLGLATVVAAVLANVLVYFAGDAVIGYDPAFVVLGNVVGIAIFTLVPAVGAVLLYAALLRWASNPPRLFTVISAIVFIVTLIPDLTYIPTVAGATAAQTGILMLMHAVAAVVIVWMLTTFAPSTSR